MSFDADTLRQRIDAQGPTVRLVITRTAGSAPRDAGTAMLVWAEGAEGTIGGGALEYAAVAEARAMLAEGRGPMHRTLPLGPAMAQCCGGSVTLVWERFTAVPALPYVRSLTGQTEMPEIVARKARRIAPGAAPLTIDGWLIETATVQPQPLWIYGAGHVGRALVNVMASLPGHAITWVDTAANRFPDTIPYGVTQVVAADPALVARHAPRDTDHLILTYSHAIDIALCHTLLGQQFASVGLIGSATKWARFRSRLAALGHRPEQILRITCPIGDPALGKHPQAIALGVATSLLKQATNAIEKGTNDGTRHTA